MHRLMRIAYHRSFGLRQGHLCPEHQAPSQLWHGSFLAVLSGGWHGSDLYQEHLIPACHCLTRYSSAAGSKQRGQHYQAAKADRLHALLTPCPQGEVMRSGMEVR